MANTELLPYQTAEVLARQIRDRTFSSPGFNLPGTKQPTPSPRWRPPGQPRASDGGSPFSRNSHGSFTWALPATSTLINTTYPSHHGAPERSGAPLSWAFRPGGFARFGTVV